MIINDFSDFCPSLEQTDDADRLDVVVPQDTLK